MEPSDYRTVGLSNRASDHRTVGLSIGPPSKVSPEQRTRVQMSPEAQNDI